MSYSGTFRYGLCSLVFLATQSCSFIAVADIAKAGNVLPGDDLASHSAAAAEQPSDLSFTVAGAAIDAVKLGSPGRATADNAAAEADKPALQSPSALPAPSTLPATPQPVAVAAVTPSPSVFQNLAARMNNVERVFIRIPGLAAMSGEYRVNGDGTIALPGIGRLKVGDTSVAEFEAQLAVEIQRQSNQETNVAVEIIDYKPVFVSGIVTRSGAFPWKPGYSVIHAETLAGGLFRGTVAGESTSIMAPSTDRERERAVRAAYELAAIVASTARLKAELNNDTTYALPSNVATLVSKSEQNALLSAQTATLKSRIAMFKSRVEASENAKAAAIREKQALEEQLDRLQNQLSKRRSLVKKIEYMTENRYARGDRLFEEQVRVAELEERLTTTTLAIARADVAANAAQQDLDTLVLSRNADVNTQLLALEQKKAELEIAIESANGTYRRVTGQDAIASRVAEPLVPRYEIVRTEQGVSRFIKADPSTPLLPGDVIVVSYGRPDAS